MRKLLFVPLLLSLSACHQTKLPEPGSLAAQHLQHISGTIGNRLTGTAKEAEVRRYITEEFTRMGYQPQVQNFTVPTINEKGERSSYDTGNVWVTLPGQDRSREIIVVAHMDTVAKGRGADDNGSGLSVLLEAAEALRGTKVPYDVRFLAVGAEEFYNQGGFHNDGSYGNDFYDGWGLIGSHHFVRELTKTPQDKAAFLSKTAFVVNLDSLIAGDHMNIYGTDSLREQAMNIAKAKGYAPQTNPSTFEYEGFQVKAGQVGYWSDHAAFMGLGIPYLYFESTNWAEGNDGLNQTEKFGPIWHTDHDQLDFLAQEFPGRTQERLTAFSAVLRDVLTTAKP